MPGLMLGKLPARDDARDLAFAKYVKAGELPPLPNEFGHEGLFPPKGWGMLGNDEWGDCAFAGPAHETMLLTGEDGQPATFTTDAVLSDYTELTHFNPQAGPPGHNPTDKGAEPREVLKYRRSTGILDAHGERHLIGAFVKLDPGNLEHVLQALHIFQVVGIGLAFPGYAMRQFNSGEPWDVVEGEPAPEGGHYVCCVGKRENINVVTWGALQQMTVPFFEKYCDEAWAYIDPETLNGGRNIEGFDLEQLEEDLADVGR